MKNKNSTSTTPAVFESDITGFEILYFSKVHNSSDINVTVKFSGVNFGANETVTFSMADVRTPAKFHKHIPHGYVIQGITLSKQITVLQEAIYRALKAPDTKMKVALPQGFSVFEGNHFYVLGNMIFPRNRVVIKDATTGSNQTIELVANNPTRLAFACQWGELKRNPKEIFSWCKTYCDQCEATTLLFLSSLTPYLRPILDDPSGNIVNAWIYGESGTGKTEQIKLVTKVTTTNYGVNLESDTAEIKKFFSSHKNRAIMTEDLNASSVPTAKLKKESRLTSLLHSTNTYNDILSGESTMDISNTALLISGEYVLPNFSTINRCLAAKMSPFVPETLTYLQNNQILYVAFLGKFITFICKNQKKLSQDVAEFLKFTSFNIPNVDKPSAYVGFSRIHHHYIILRVTAHLVNKFFAELKLDTSIQDCLEEAIEHCVKETLCFLRHPSGYSEITSAFLEIFEKKKYITLSLEKFLDKKECLFLLHEDYIYFRGEKVSKYLSDLLGKNISKQAISSELKNADLLCEVGSNRSERLPASIEGASNLRIRFYCIYVPDLVEMLESKYGEHGYIGLGLRKKLDKQEEQKEKFADKEKKKLAVLIRMGSEESWGEDYDEGDEEKEYLDSNDYETDYEDDYYN